MGQAWASLQEKLQGRHWKERQVRKITDKVFDRLTEDAPKREKEALKFEEVYIAVLCVYNDINKYLPGPHYDPPSKERLKELMISMMGAAYGMAVGVASMGVTACMVTFTVGGLSAINTIAGAFSENLPIICIVGGPNSNDYDSNRILHHTIGSRALEKEEYSCWGCQKFLLDYTAIEMATFGGVFFCVVVLAVMLPCLNVALGQSSDPSEVGALGAIKGTLLDPINNLENWNKGDPCTSNWIGVFCHIINDALHVTELAGDAVEQVRAGQEEDTAAAGAKKIQALRILKGLPPWRRSVRSASLREQPATKGWPGCYVDRGLHSLF